MPKLFNNIFIIILALFVIFTPYFSEEFGKFNLKDLSAFPVLHNGRIKPLDTVTRITLANNNKDYISPYYTNLKLLKKSFSAKNSLALFYPIPPLESNINNQDWKSISQAQKSDNDNRMPLNPAINYYAQIIKAYNLGDHQAFNQAVSNYKQLLESLLPTIYNKSKLEALFNQFDFIKKIMLVFFLSCLFIFLSIFLKYKFFQELIFYVILLGLLLQIAFLSFHIWLQNHLLISSFTMLILLGSAFAILLLLIIEKIYKNGIGNFCAGILGLAAFSFVDFFLYEGDYINLFYAIYQSNYLIIISIIFLAIGIGMLLTAGLISTQYIIKGIILKIISARLRKQLVYITYIFLSLSFIFFFLGLSLKSLGFDQNIGLFWNWDLINNSFFLIIIWLSITLILRVKYCLKDRVFMALVLLANVMLFLLMIPSFNSRFLLGILNPKVIPYLITIILFYIFTTIMGIMPKRNKII